MARPRKQVDDARDVFNALADPTRRRRALELLAPGERSVQDLVDHFPMSLAAVSQHLQMLHPASLVKRREAGRWLRRRPRGLASVRSWIEGLAHFRHDAFDSLEAHLDDLDDDAR